MNVSFQPVRLAQTQINPFTAMMGRAFVNDPFLQYLAPDEGKRTQLTPEFVGIVVKYCAIYDTETLHKQFAPGPHWYLWGLGVEPTHQDKGVGSALLQPVLREADKDGLPCYLETQNETNLPFYHKHGFAVMSDGVVPKGSLRVWAMVRKPQGR